MVALRGKRSAIIKKDEDVRLGRSRAFLTYLYSGFVLYQLWCHDMACP